MTDAPNPTQPESTTKVDPETLVLRGSPRRVVRFRKGVIIGAVAAGSIGIASATWLALKPATFRMVAQPDERPMPENQRPPKALAAAPDTYADVPKLGPPLPGDLGGPILKHRQSIDGAAVGGSAAGETERAAQAAEAERQRIAAERQTARESAVLVSTSGSSRSSDAPPVTGSELPSTPPLISDLGDREPVGPSNSGDQQRKLDFVAARHISGDLNAHMLAPPASPWMLSAGSVIAASLITGLNSDLPGLVVAQVTEHAYDTATGRTLLIPQGSRLIGSYDSVVAFGQSRALLVWQRIVLPDGSSIRIDNLPASDAAGFAGLADDVDFHTWSLLKGIALSTLLGVGTELSLGSEESDLVRAVRESTQQNASRAGDQIVAKNLDIQPTIRVRPGWPLRIVVHKDLVLRPWSGSGG